MRAFVGFRFVQGCRFPVFVQRVFACEAKGARREESQGQIRDAMRESGPPQHLHSITTGESVCLTAESPASKP
jgi:hypothetical protein